MKGTLEVAFKEKEDAADALSIAQSQIFQLQGTIASLTKDNGNFTKTIEGLHADVSFLGIRLL